MQLDAKLNNNQKYLISTFIYMDLELKQESIEDVDHENNGLESIYRIMDCFDLEYDDVLNWYLVENGLA